MTNVEMTDRELLEDLREKVQENTRITKKLLTRARMQNVFFFIKWFIYVGALIGLYSFLSPQIDKLISTYKTLADGAESINEIKNENSSLDLKNMLDLLK